MHNRQSINLRSLPVWMQYFIALAVLAMISFAAWLVGRDDPVPHWVSKWVVPNLVWVFFGLIIIAVIGTVVEHRKR